MARFEERGEPSLDQVGDRLELVQRRSAVYLGQDAHQLVPLACGLHAIQVRGQLAELHGFKRRALGVVCATATRYWAGRWSA